MAKQTKPINAQCGARLPRGAGRCINSATIGVFHWNYGETDVNLDKPVAVFCGCHKPRLHRNQSLRNVRLMTV
jgi:hypothetical protein